MDNETAFSAFDSTESSDAASLASTGASFKDWNKPNLSDAYLVDANIAKAITKGANLENTILE